MHILIDDDELADYAHRFVVDAYDLTKNDTKPKTEIILMVLTKILAAMTGIRDRSLVIVSTPRASPILLRNTALLAMCSELNGRIETLSTSPERIARMIELAAFENDKTVLISNHYLVDDSIDRLFRQVHWYVCSGVVAFFYFSQPPLAYAPPEQQCGTILSESTDVEELTRLTDADIQKQRHLLSAAPLRLPDHLKVSRRRYFDVITNSRSLSFLEKKRLLFDVEFLAHMSQETLDSLLTSLEGGTCALKALDDVYNRRSEKALDIVTNGLLTKAKKLIN